MVSTSQSGYILFRSGMVVQFVVLVQTVCLSPPLHPLSVTVGVIGDYCVGGTLDLRRIRAAAHLYCQGQSERRERWS